MIVFVCLDPDGGMLFHHRRQSSDRVVTADMLVVSQGRRLWMDPYSEKLFAGRTEGIMARETFLELAGPEDCCFVENRPLSAYADQIERLIVYRWDKVYPKDMMFDLNLADWTLENTVCLEGHSHANIERETYVRPED